MNRVLSSDIASLTGQEVTVAGWVHSRRDHGGLIFIDLRDHKGLTQLTIRPEEVTKDVFAAAESLRDEYVVEATGDVREREAALKNPNIVSGNVELVVRSLRILNKAETLPIPVNSTELSSEENRLKYRYLDLRRPKMQYMLKKRADMYKFIRAYMEEQDFTEIATPVLANSSPEGARDFLVPSRIHPGKFYALPQAPQQFKQLLMVGGVHRYYQFATCFRDEDPRADRLYGDFYQLDLEMSFVEDGEIVRSIIDPLIKRLVNDFGQKQLQHNDIPRITYAEAMERYGSDKPDTRFGMELIDLTEELTDCGFGVFANAISSGGAVKAIRVEGSTFSRSQLDKLTDIAKSEGAGGLPYMTVEGGKAVSSITKFFQDEHLQSIVDKTGAVDGDTILFGADKRNKVNKILGNLRNYLADQLELKDPNSVAALWVIDFPFYEWDEKTNKLDFGHNPFSMPKGGVEALEAEDKLSIVADQFDLVMNGYECASGAVRNHSPDIMYRVFDLLGYDKAYVEAKFGALLNAFRYGAPPHAGCAPGLDRIFMILMGEDNIREIIAFPKNGSGVDLMMQSPSPVDDQQLKELGIRCEL